MRMVMEPPQLRRWAAGSMAGLAERLAELDVAFRGGQFSSS